MIDINQKSRNGKVQVPGRRGSYFVVQTDMTNTSVYTITRLGHHVATVVATYDGETLISCDEGNFDGEHEDNEITRLVTDILIEWV